MALVLSDRIKETTTTTSTGTYTLGGAVSGFETFTANLSNGDTTYYCCTDGTDFEVGLGTFASSGTTLARTTIISSSNSNNAVNWSSGTRDIFCTLPGSKAVVLDANGALSTGITVQDEGSGLSTTAKTLNFVGSGIVASGTGDTKTITVTGGGIGTSTANYFDAHSSSNSSALTDSFATIDFDTVRYNSSGSVFSESAGEVTMTTTGIHRFHTDVTTKITSGSNRSDCEIELQRKPSGGSFSQVAGSTAVTYNRISGRGEQTSSIDILYNVTSGDAYRIVAKRQGGTDTIVIQGGAARFNISSVGANPSVATTAADDLTTGDAAVNLTTTSGNITIDAQGSDTDIILKGTDGSSDTTFLTLDGSDAGTATFNNKVVATGGIELPQTSGNAIKTTGNLTSADLGIIRVASSDGGTHGFTIKYMGSRSGNNNSYSLFMDNQTGTDVEVMTVLQDGKVGINNTSPSAPLDVSGDAEITGTLTAGEVSATTLDIGGTNITSTATEINKLDGVTATTTELNYVDVTTLGTVQASKAVTADANGDVLFPDDEILKFGDSGDLTIQHNGNHSVIKDGGTGNLELAGSVVAIKNGARTENGIVFTQDGSVDLYHDNSKKLETTSTGATVTGTLTATDAAIGADTDIMVELGRAAVGAIFTDYAGLRHIDMTGGTEYAFLQQSNGNTFVNAGNSLNVYFRVDNNNVAILHSTHLQLFTGKKLVFEGDTANDHETTLYVTDPTADRTVTLPDATGTVLTTGNSDTPSTTTSSSDADFVLVDDGGTMKKITPSNLGITSGGASKGFAVAMAIAL